MERKILIALDGSTYGTNALHYLCQLFKDVHDIHLHLLSLIPGSSGPQPSQWQDQVDFMNSISPANKKKKERCQKIINNSSQYLQRNGIDKIRITSSIHFSCTSIASEIISEARKGLYDALVIGRRGLGKLEEWIMGSVSGAVLEKCPDVPIWIIDGQVDSARFLVPVDGSPHCLKALDHLSFILQDHPFAEITLFNSKAFFTKNCEIDLEACSSYLGKEWCDNHYNIPDSLFTAPKQILLDAGFPPGRIHTCQTSKGLYPSRQIVRQALVHDFGTIVMGRREGLYKKGAFKGVSDRVLAMAEQVAIWIV